MKGTLHTQRLGRLFFAAATFVLLVAGALIGAPAAAADTAISETTAFTYTADNLCTGELISGTGNMHFLLHENLSANGAIEHYLDVHIDGLKAIGMTSGKTYIVQDVYSDEFVIAGATEETFDITAHFIRQGEDGTLILGDDFYEYMRTHKAVRQLTMMLAKAGYHLLRFDYFGTGDSAGDGEDVTVEQLMQPAPAAIFARSVLPEVAVGRPPIDS